MAFTYWSHYKNQLFDVTPLFFVRAVSISYFTPMSFLATDFHQCSEMKMKLVYPILGKNFH